ncbi:queuosine-tRNA galactosyltransferase isoform X2 [Hyperolius riggenbachi]|uniref:queuosine-tRNA galactosyltransferase isoform X2 n=1 Tax=Hyperolius riggenbachi TaxID=752182 RepID=UPI0035A32364
MNSHEGRSPASPSAEASGEDQPVDVSVIIPTYNAEAWLDQCLTSVHLQDFCGSLEVSIYNDGSTDSSGEIIERWKSKLGDRGILVTVGGHASSAPRGVGYGKNRAICQSSGRYLCFLDSIIGCKVRREPPDATERYTRWINSMTPQQLCTQVFTSHGPTVIMPTWFCSREWFCYVGQFVEDGQGTPEDLLFFYEHLRKGGGVHRVDECLLQYRYHQHAATHSISEETIWEHRVRFLEERVLCHWPAFTIWNAGKQGRKLYRSLSPGNREKVVAFCDVDKNKIVKGFYTYEESEKRPKPKIPILHFSEAKPPFIICVKLDLTGGGFEENLKSLKLKEGRDYHHFS